MQLNGSCHCRKVAFSVKASEPIPFMRCYCSICRKTAGTGGYAINLGAESRSMKVTGKRHLRIYRADLKKNADAPPLVSPARRYFCGLCGTALWTWDARWPDLVHPHASAIDTPLPTPPENFHIMLGSKAAWVTVEGRPQDRRFEEGPDLSLAEWHAARGLTSVDPQDPDGV